MKNNNLKKYKEAKKQLIKELLKNLQDNLLLLEELGGNINLTVIQDGIFTVTELMTLNSIQIDNDSKVIFVDYEGCLLEGNNE